MSFIHDNFLLQSDIAQDLFHNAAKKLPIIDYHNHLNIPQMAANENYANLAKLWIEADPYKHRAMRINGIAEKYITGDASDFEKFASWASSNTQSLANPLFHWTCLELKRCFGFDEILSAENAKYVWDLYQENKLKPQDIIEKFNVEKICSSDNIFDDLSFHRNIKYVDVRPSLRADSIVDIEDICAKVKNLDEYKLSVVENLDKFQSAGCRLSDHSLDSGFMFNTDGNPDKIFAQVLKGNPVDMHQLTVLKSHLLLFLGGEYAKREWTMQLHIGAIRSTSDRLRKLSGASGGYAAIGSECRIDHLCKFLNTLEQNDALGRTFIYNLNPADNALFATLCGSFTGDGIMAKTQFGPAWWYNDHFQGISSHLETLGSYGLLAHFVGMTTDARSILSFARHEYFRRILCNTIGDWVEKGHLPDDKSLLYELVKNISYYNARKIFQ